MRFVLIAAVVLFAVACTGSKTPAPTEGAAGAAAVEPAMIRAAPETSEATPAVEETPAAPEATTAK